MYQQFQQQPQHSQGSQPNGGHQNREGVDPIHIRQLYRNELATLTFNSKPIITSLTIAAQENIGVAKVIVQTIEDRLRTAPPNQKLPTLYLIDSIIKNVGGPYLHLFGRSIVTLFLDAYAVVDPTVRASFQKVLGTWPNWNTQLFPRDAITRIERGVMSIQQQQQPFQPAAMHVNPHFTEPHPRDNAFNAQDPRQMNRPAEPSVDKVLMQDIQLLLLHKQQAIIANPGDQASAKQATILQQLLNIVQTTQLTPENANMIRQQLSQLWTATPGLPGYPPGAMGQNLAMAPPLLPPNMMMAPSNSVAPSSSIMSVAPPVPPFPAGMPNMPSAPVMTGVVAPPPPPVASTPSIPLPTTAAVPILPGQASDLFASLMQSGLLGPNGTLNNQLLQNAANMNRAPQSPMVATPPLPSAPLDRVGQSEQDQSIMSLGLIELTSQDIQRRRPASIQVMYGTPPLQCNQCGYRCPKSADAQKKMDAHLDWHFRQNRRMKDKAKKSHSRSWLVGEEDWIHSREGDLGHGQQPVFFDFGSGMSKAVSKDELALQEEVAQLKEQIVSETSLVQDLRGDERDTVTVQGAMNTISKGCSVCKEKFIKIWNEAEEEWSYKNASVVDKVIYHATCHADLVRSNQRQAALVEAALAAAAAAATTASAEATPQQTNKNASFLVEPKMEQKDTKADDLLLSDTTQVEQWPDIIKQQHSVDQEMTGADSDLPLSLKRKLEIDQQEEEQMATKKTILA
ncbi:hypothetical protein BGZ54_007341 [Gamsiella multidivaricata]|nr:hypothetical protein BGZ54_007341 [Gamsiella multidivaricata]